MKSEELSDLKHPPMAVCCFPDEITQLFAIKPASNVSAQQNTGLGPRRAEVGSGPTEQPRSHSHLRTACAGVEVGTGMRMVCS